MYLIDMYRGVIQHGAFITNYLKKDSIDRGLDKPIGLGRIFRVVHETTQPRHVPKLGNAAPTELVAQLSAANAWQRDMAQQLLAQRNVVSAVPELKKLATSGSDPRAWFGPEERWSPSSGRPRRGPPTAWRSTSLSSPIVPNWVRSSSECGTDDCGRTSAPSRPSTVPSPPSTQPSDARGRRSFAFAREDF